MDLDLSESSKQVIREILKSKDQDGNGVISQSELCDCLMAFGFCPTPDEARFLQTHFDRSGDGNLEIEDIVDNLDVIIAHSVKGDELIEAFQKFDIGKDGFIRTSELLAVLTAEGEYQMSLEEARELINELLAKFDQNKDGKFSYSEFVRIVMHDGIPS